ncbi:MAG TPA: response regulator [Cyclobacteriaceae bacterium]|nr:response regulator [Cyclobacteriaceae bacterium]
MKMIVLAEDDSDDQDMVREIVGVLNEDVELRIFDDGEALLSSMKTLPKQSLPGLIILDQNMPKLKGSDTIGFLKGIRGFENIPVVIYTTYHDNKFADACKRMNVELFRKPDTFDAFSELIGGLMERYINN